MMGSSGSAGEMANVYASRMGSGRCRSMSASLCIAS
jgi:hypothetical protein